MDLPKGDSDHRGAENRDENQAAGPSQGNPLKLPAARDPMALAMEWVARITTVALEMVLPGIFGQRLDAKWGTGYLAIAGFTLGLTVGMWHLLQMTKSTSRKTAQEKAAKSSAPAAHDRQHEDKAKH